MGRHQNGCHGMNDTELFLLNMVAMNLHRCIIGISPYGANADQVSEKT
jgi:hypothetical protein